MIKGTILSASALVFFFFVFPLLSGISFVIDGHFGGAVVCVLIIAVFLPVEWPILKFPVRPVTITNETLTVPLSPRRDVAIPVMSISGIALAPCKS